MNYTTTTNASNYHELPINTGINSQHSCFSSILQKLYERMGYMTRKHSRVLFVRFDVRFPTSMITDGSNEQITRLFKMLMDSSTYHSYGLHYVWVREQSKEKHQHYHCVALLNGNKVQNHSAFLQSVSHAWNHVLGVQCNGLINFCNKHRDGSPAENGVMIRRPKSGSTGAEQAEQERAFNQAFENCFYWSSYLAKTNQKSNTPKGLRKFGVSVMR